MSAVFRTLGRGARLGGSLATKLFTTPAGWATIGAGATTFATGQYMGLGDEKDFFEHSFVADGKKADAIVDFYSTEEFLQILGIFPFAIHFILGGVQWKEDRDNAMEVYGSMLIQFDLTERIIKDKDGKDVVGFFNKRERFVNYVPFSASFGLPILLWDQTQNYGFRRLKDGSLQVIHNGEAFHGPWPIKYLVKLHAMYVIWATEKHLQSELFGSEDLEAVEEQRSNIPAMAFKEFIAKLESDSKVALEQSKTKGEDTTAAQANLAKLQSMQKDKSLLANAEVVEKTTAGKTRLRRRQSTIKTSDPEAQAAIAQALAAVQKMEGGQEAQKALQEMLKKAAAASA